MVWDHGTRVRITVLPQVNEALSNEAPDFTGSKFYYEPLTFFWNLIYIFVYYRELKETCSNLYQVENFDCKSNKVVRVHKNIVSCFYGRVA